MFNVTRLSYHYLTSNNVIKSVIKDKYEKWLKTTNITERPTIVPTLFLNQSLLAAGPYVNLILSVSRKNAKNIYKLTSRDEDNNKDQ